MAISIRAIKHIKTGRIDCQNALVLHCVKNECFEATISSEASSHSYKNTGTIITLSSNMESTNKILRAIQHLRGLNGASLKDKTLNEYLF